MQISRFSTKYLVRSNLVRTRVEDSHLIGEYDASGTMLVEYILMGGKPIATVYPGNRIVNITTDYQNKPRSGMDAVTGQQVWY